MEHIHIGSVVKSLKMRGGGRKTWGEKGYFLSTKLSVNVSHALLLTLRVEQLVGGFIAQLNPHDAGLHHDVVTGVEVA